MKKGLLLLLCCIVALFPFCTSYAEEGKELNIATNRYYALKERMEQFEQESGISITCELSVDMMDTISTAYVIKTRMLICSFLFLTTAYILSKT